MLDPLQNRTRLLTEHIHGGVGGAAHADVALRRVLREDDQRIAHREYYDLTTDPYEMENLLAGQQPATTRRHRRCRRSSRLDCVGTELPDGHGDQRIPTAVWLSGPPRVSLREKLVRSLIAAAAPDAGACGGDDNNADSGTTSTGAQLDQTTNTGTGG